MIIGRGSGKSLLSLAQILSVTYGVSLFEVYEELLKAFYEED